MKINEIDEYYLNLEVAFQDLNELTAEYIISEYKKLGSYHKYDDNPLASLLINYFNLKKKEKHQVLEDVLNKYSINYKSSIHNAIYLMFRGKSYNISVKQHICELDALTCKDFTGSSGKGIKSRIRIKDYDKLPQNLILTKENMRNSIERATDWQVKRKSDKDNLMIIQKSFLYGEDISLNIIKETPNIEKIIQIIENL